MTAECPHSLPPADCVACSPQPHLVLRCEACQANTWHVMAGRSAERPDDAWGRRWSCRRCSTVRGGLRTDRGSEVDLGISP